jgi:hypothetical protein
MYLPVLVAFYAVTLVSFAQNVFAYNSIILAWLIFVAYLLMTTLPAARLEKHNTARI